MTKTEQDELEMLRLKYFRRKQIPWTILRMAGLVLACIIIIAFILSFVVTLTGCGTYRQTPQERAQAVEQGKINGEKIFGGQTEAKRRRLP